MQARARSKARTSERRVIVSSYYNAKAGRPEYDRRHYDGAEIAAETEA
jgi:hypothetical protein